MQVNTSHLKPLIDTFFVMVPADMGPIIKDIEKINTILQTLPLLNKLNNHLSVNKDQKIILWQILLEHLDVTSYTKNYFLAIGKLGLLQNIPFVIQKILKHFHNDTVDVFVNSATALEPTFFQTTIDRLKQLNPIFNDKKFHWHTTIDPHLLGGYTLSVTPYWLDVSVRTQLKKLEQQVKK